MKLVGDAKPDIVLILGMHRSGTSAVANALSHLGLRFGSDLLGAANENPAGFFENTEVRALHDTFLKELGYSWFDPRPLPKEWSNSPAAQHAVDKITAHLREKAIGGHILAVKDPRLCRLLPLWLEACKTLNLVPAIVLVVRHPNEVAASLRERNGMLTSTSLRLYMIYLAEAVGHSQSLSTAIVDYARLLEEPRREILAIAEKLNLPSPNKLNEAAYGVVESYYRNRRSQLKISPMYLEMECKCESLFNQIFRNTLDIDFSLVEYVPGKNTSLVSKGRSTKPSSVILVPVTKSMSGDSAVLLCDYYLNNDDAYLVLVLTDCEEDYSSTPLMRKLCNDSFAVFSAGEDPAQLIHLFTEYATYHLVVVGGGLQLDATEVLRLLNQKNSSELPSGMAAAREIIKSTPQSSHETTYVVCPQDTSEAMALSSYLSSLSDVDFLKTVALDARVLSSCTALRELARASSTHDEAGTFKGNTIDGYGQQVEARPITILVPVYNACEQTLRCIDSVVKNTPPPHTIIVLDDGSTDIRLIDNLDILSESSSRVRLLRAKKNIGYLRTANNGILAAENDIVLLNSDTVVPPGWLERLSRCLYSDEKIGIVCPLSNNATLLSVPDPNQQSVGIEPQSTDLLDLLVQASSIREYPRIPVAVGFCMLVRMEICQKLGCFDEVFGAGYGEECDLSMRVWRAGYEIACADNVYVYHEGSASFGKSNEQREELRNNEAILYQRYPYYYRSVRQYCVTNPLRRIGERIRWLQVRSNDQPKPSILIVTHRYNSIGGVESHLADMVAQLASQFRLTVIAPERMEGRWTDIVRSVDQNGVEILTYNLNNVHPSRSFVDLPADIDCQPVEEFFRNFIESGSWDVVHFHHLAEWNSLRLPDIAAQAGAKVILSLHDFYFHCPDYNQLEPGGSYCEKNFANAEDGSCLDCLAAKSNVANVNINSLAEYLTQRRKATKQIFEASSHIFTPSSFSFDRHLLSFSIIGQKEVSILPHGIPSEYQPLKFRKKDILRVAFVGRFCFAKGADVFLSITRRLEKDRFRFVVLGELDERYRKALELTGVQVLGQYTRSNMGMFLSEVDMVVIPSIFPESFCLTLSECQYQGVPVAASCIGAIPERLMHNETGFLFPPGDVDALRDLLLGIHEDQDRLSRVRRKLGYIQRTSLKQNAIGYSEVYKNIIGKEPRKKHHIAYGKLYSKRTIEQLCGCNANNPLFWHPGTRTYARYVDKEKILLPSNELKKTDFAFVLDAHTGTPESVSDTLASISAIASEAVVLILSSAGDELPKVSSGRNLQVRFVSSEHVGSMNQSLSSDSSEWLVYVQAGDLLDTVHWTRMIEKAIRHEDVAAVYGDWDLLSKSGDKYSPHFLPSLGLETMRTSPQLLQTLIVRKRAWYEVGGFWEAGKWSAVDLMFRLYEKYGNQSLYHYRGILTHRLDRNGRDRLLSEAENIVAAHLVRKGLPATAISEQNNYLDVHYSAGSELMVTVLVTLGNTGGRRGQLSNVLSKVGRGIILQLVVIVFDSNQQLSTAELRRLKNYCTLGVVLRKGDPSNFCQTLNNVLRNVTTDYALVLDSNVVAVSDGWLSRLMEVFLQPDVVAAGGKTVAPSGKVIGGALVLGAGKEGVADLLEKQAAPDWFSAFSGQKGRSNVSALTLNCLAFRKKGFDELGGLRSEKYLGELGVLDLLVQLGQKGYQIIYDRRVVLMVDNVSNPANISESELAYFFEDWLPILADDASYNLELSLANIGQPEVVLRRKELVETEKNTTYIGAYPFDDWGIGEYRVRSPMRALDGTANYCTTIFNTESSSLPTPTQIERAGIDILYLHNALHDEQLRRITQYHVFNDIPIVFGQDDLLSRLPQYNPYSKTNYPNIEKRIHLALSFCDRLIVTTDPLSDAFRPLGVDAVVIPNYLERQKWIHSERSAGREEVIGMKPRIGWAGGAQHSGDLLVLVDVIEQLHEKYDWVFFGDCPKAIQGLVTEFHPAVPIAEYPRKLASLRLDLALAPLQVNAFNETKSNLRILEYGVLGYPVICTDIHPYQTAPVIRVQNRTSDWIEAIEELVNEKTACRNIGLNLRDWVLSDWMLDQHIDQWGDAFRF